MTLEEANRLIKRCAEQMNSRYHQVVFDEWAVVSLSPKRNCVLHYTGPRNTEFMKNFASDLGALRVELMHRQLGVGDFEFTRHGVGTLFEGFMVLGEGLYLICNNTRNSMDGITRDPRWLDAQVPFVELSDQIRSAAPVCSS